MLCYSMFPVVVIAFLVLLTGTLAELYQMEPLLGAKVIGTMVGIHFIVIASIYLSIHAVRKAEEEYNMEKLNYMLDLQRESLEHFIAQERELYQLRHELERKLFTVQYLLEKGNTEEGLRVMRQTIREMCGDAGDISVSQNIVDTVVANLERKAGADGVKMEKEICFSDDTIMDLADLCVLLGNLLDNAVEAAVKSAGKQVRINVKEEFACLFIRVSNTYSRENSDVKNFVSRKEGVRLRHGYGIQNIREIVRRYGGEFVTRDEGEWFYAEVIIYDKK
ncbi:MAG: GHKL domain-containing protein [Lachnospiraceae bacterium]|nr:GHKL domain-containing protein [Lachnospiraceae bacterium]